MFIGIGIGTNYGFGAGPPKTAGALRLGIPLTLLLVPELMLTRFSLLFGDIVTNAGGFDSGALARTGLPSLIGRTQVPSLSLLLCSDGYGL